MSSPALGLVLQGWRLHKPGRRVLVSVWEISPVPPQDPPLRGFKNFVLDKTDIKVSLCFKAIQKDPVCFLKGDFEEGKAHVLTNKPDKGGPAEC